MSTLTTYPDDSELLQKFSITESRNWAFNQLVRKYSPRIYQHIRKLVIDHDDANDLVQETFLKVWGSLEDFRQASSLFTWIYRIATNEALAFLRKKRQRFFLPLVDYSAELTNKLVAQHAPSGDEIQLKLQKAILRLPDKQRLVFNLRYYDELPYEEMSEITGTSVGALKASYHLAVKKIEEYLNED
ncbi:RNA polymerase sigma factor [Cesiribacter andamanensis]|uniref:Sigma-24 n=1 Tax=Cesiribacter andamanensis AMV16 TaxID=1279009 RepID=M7N1P6_9BACT|nr:sigma-70 family RNA polymerase sigma factor [Cesiribacter andamanensis]EMR01146.1 Sigma-24 [Cesiribacter andamanensis AMV16]